MVNLRPCVAQRGEFIKRYRQKQADLSEVERYAPFIAAEIRRQGLLPDYT